MRAYKRPIIAISGVVLALNGCGGSIPSDVTSTQVWVQVPWQQFIYSLFGLAAGLYVIIKGLSSSVPVIVGATSISITILGDKITLENPYFGMVLVIVGLLIIRATKYDIHVHNKCDSKLQNKVRLDEINTE